MREIAFFSESFNELSISQSDDPFSGLSCGGIAQHTRTNARWSCNMKVLKSLTFGVMSRGSQDSALARRAKLVHRLEQQKKLA